MRYAVIFQDVRLHFPCISLGPHNDAWVLLFQAQVVDDSLN